MRQSLWLCALASISGCNLILGIEDHERAPLGTGGTVQGGVTGSAGQGGLEGGAASGNGSSVDPETSDAGAGGGLEEPAGGLAGSAGAAGDAIATGGLSGGGSGGNQGSVIAGSGGMAPLGGPLSCVGLPSNCGPEHDESCCTSLLVPGGRFQLKDQDATDGFDATVSDFRLDRFEVTVGRFQNFRVAWKSGWRPGPGDGKHAFLNDQHGLLDTSAAGDYELGWNSEWNALVDAHIDNVALNIDKTLCEDEMAANEPVRCIRWWEAYAFCIWDGGFLPSEAEWYYAASGGETRLYAWDGSSIDCQHANSSECFFPPRADEVGSRPEGDGFWRQADLSGNVWEWVLDFYQDPYEACENCTNGEEGMFGHSLRGGSFENPRVEEGSQRKLEAAHRSYIVYSGEPELQGYGVGMRCARAP